MTRRRDEDELRRLSLVASKTANGVLILDAAGRAEWANDAFTQITGYAQNEMQEPNSLARLRVEAAPNEDKTENRKTENRTGSETDAAPGQRVERLCRHKDGRLIWLEIEQTEIADAGGATLQAIALIANATERREAQDALRQREQTYRMLTESMSDMVSLHEMNGVCIFVSPSVERLTGFTVEETIGRTFYEWTHPDDQALVGRRSSERNLLQNSAKTQWRRRRKDGSYLWLETQTDVIHDAEGKPDRLLYASRDISERKKAEEHIAERARLADFSAAIGQAVTQTRSHEALLQACAEVIAAHFDTGLVRLWTWKAGENAMRLQAEAGHSLKASKDSGSLPVSPLALPPEWAGQPDSFPAALERLRQSEAPLTAQLGMTIAAYPLIIENRMLGALSLFLRGPLSRPAPGALSAAADSIALGLQRCWETQTLAAQTAQLADALEEANRAAKQRSEFVAAISHEIRTPLHGVIGMTGLLMETELTTEQRELGEMARASADILLRLLNDILDFSKIEAGRLSLRSAPFDLCQIIEDTAESFAPRAYEKGLDIAVHCAADLPLSLIGDSGRIQQIVTNLTDNAVKFTHRGAISLNVSWQARDDQSGQVIIQVSDTGIGIEPGSIERVFEPFTQASPTELRQNGAGLGLTISRHIAALMGGALAAESAAGQGSTFRLTLPLSRDPALPAAPPAESPLANARILLMAAQPLREKALQKMMLSWKARVVLCPGVSQLLPMLREAAAANLAFQIALLDDDAPGMEDLAPVRALLSDPALRATRPALLIAPRRLSDTRVLRDAGITAWMRKPVRQSHLRFTLISLLESSAPPAPPAPVSPALSSPAAPPKTGPRILVAEDNIISQKIAALTLEKIGCRVEAVSSGAEALRRLETESYDLILMDCQMPDKDGFETTREIRRREASTGRRAPIVAMTANLMPGASERCLDAGMDAYLAKPIQQETLLKMARALFPLAPVPAPSDSEVSAPQSSLSASSGQIFAPQTLLIPPVFPEPAPVSAPQQTEPPEALNRDALLNRVGGSPNLLRSLTKLYAAEWPKLRQEIQQALDLRERDAFQRGAHKLRGVLMSLEAGVGIAAMRRLEHSAAAPDWPENAVPLLAEVTAELQRIQESLNAMQTE